MTDPIRPARNMVVVNLRAKLTPRRALAEGTR